MMSPGTTSLSGAVDALGAMKREPLVALEGRVGCSSFEGLDTFTLKLLCVKTLIANILLYRFAYVWVKAESGLSENSCFRPLKK